MVKISENKSLLNKLLLKGIQKLQCYSSVVYPKTRVLIQKKPFKRQG